MLASSNLLSLPEEIILKILAEGDYRAILACKCVRSVPCVYLLVTLTRNVLGLAGRPADGYTTSSLGLSAYVIL